MNEPAPIEKEITTFIKILNSGIEFYQEALNKLKDGTKKVLFNRMIEEKKQAVIALQPYTIEQHSHAESGRDLGDDVENMYAQIIAGLSANEELKYINPLEKVEDKVLTRLDKALEVNQPSECAAELRRIRSRMQQCHDELKLLQVETA